MFLHFFYFYYYFFVYLFCKTLTNSLILTSAGFSSYILWLGERSESGRGRATGNHFSVRAAERAGEQMKAHFPLIKSSENIPFVSATAAETGPGPRSQPTGSVDYVAATIYIAHWQHHHFPPLMSSFSSFYPSPCPSTLPTASLHPPPHPSHGAQRLPPLQQPIFVWSALIARLTATKEGESREGPGSISVTVIFNVINFNFQSFFPCSSPSFPSFPPFLLQGTHLGNLSICFSLLSLFHSFWLPPFKNTYWLLSYPMSSPRLLPHKMQFSPGRLCDEI